MNTIEYNALDPFVKEAVNMDKPKKRFKDQAGHDLFTNVTGNYESVLLFCDVCGLAFKFSRSEIEGLESVKI